MEAVHQVVSRKRNLKETSIRTILRRLEQKGYLRHEEKGRAYVYRAVEPARSLAARAVRQIIDSFCQGSVEELVSGMVEAKVLSKGELETLEEFVRSRKGAQMTILFESAIRVTLIAAIIGASAVRDANQDGVGAARRVGQRRRVDAAASGLGGVGTESLPSGPATRPDSCHRAFAPAVTGGAGMQRLRPAPYPTPSAAPPVRAGDTSRFICLESECFCCASPSARSARAG